LLTKTTLLACTGAERPAPTTLTLVLLLVNHVVVLLVVDVDPAEPGVIADTAA